jgi:hypothetical protein
LKGIKAITVIQIFNSLVLLILALFQKDIGIGYRASFMDYNYYKYYYHPEDMVLPGIIILIFICINVYIYYILFSFTKHLGLGNEILISNNKPTSIPQNNQDSRNLSALLPPNNQSTELIINNTFTQYVSLEKIVLNFPNDITFAQSAQNSIVKNLVLPSGFETPSGRDGTSWKIEGNEIVLV